jgi:hypothetical protein
MFMDLKSLIKNSEDRCVSYKKLLEEFHQKTYMYETSEIEDWFKEFLRDGKNFEEGWLKKLIEEKSFENSGLNPPFCYR